MPDTPDAPSATPADRSAGAEATESGVTERWSYARAGVDIDAGNALIKRIGPASRATHRPELLTGLGGFAALSALPPGYREPILVSGTDGVGTKLRLAINTRQHDTIGQDLVAMCVNDILVTGAEPLFFLDYFATGRLEVDVAARVIEGIAAACKTSGCSLAGGETAEMPGHYTDGDYDLAGFCVGIADRDRLIDGSAISAGDRLLALPSSGAHANGFSLIHRLLDLEPAPQTLIPRPTSTELLTPTRLYVAAVRALGLAQATPVDPLPVRGMAHVTGGGLTENLPRMLRNEALALKVDLDRWTLPSLFQWLQDAGHLTDEEMLRTFNCGVGFVFCLPEAACHDAIRALEAVGEAPFEIGTVVERGESAIEFGGTLN